MRFETLNNPLRNVTAAAALALGSAILIASGCSKPAPQATNSPPKTTAPKPSPASGAPKLGDASSVASSLGLDLPEMHIPTQEEIDAKVSAEINKTNADTAFKDLQKDIDDDSGG